LRGGRYQAIVTFLHWVDGSTNNPFLDPPERYAGGWSWHADSIRHLRQEYRRALTLRQQVDDLRRLAGIRSGPTLCPDDPGTLRKGPQQR